MSVQLHLGDCLDIMRRMPDGSVDAVVTDPPYGIGKAVWDDAFPTEWVDEAKRLVGPEGLIVVLTNGGDALKSAIESLGDLYRSTFAAWLCNGMKRGPISFSNWTAIVVGSEGRKWKPIQDVFRVVINTREKIDHPSPKPIDLMNQVVERLSHPGETILDPFMGSGSTGVACVRTGRNFVGIEIDPAYHAIACKRIDAEMNRHPLLTA